MPIRPYGSWPSPLSPQALVAGARSYSELATDGDTLVWIEARPEEAGRQVAMRRLPDGRVETLTGAEVSVRSRVHEYGGGALQLLPGGDLLYTADHDQRLYRLTPGERAQVLGQPGALRYADAVWDRWRRRVICIVEDHGSAGEPRNRVVSMAGDRPSVPQTVYADADFVAAPALSPDGRWLAFLAWNHPNLPWDEVRLMLAELDRDGQPLQVSRINRGVAESVLSPRWSPQGLLHFISDRDDWWNLYRLDGAGQLQQLTRERYEFGRPMWTLNHRLYDFLPDGRIAALINTQGREGLALVDPESGRVERPELGLASSAALAVGGSTVYLVAGFADRPGGLAAYQPSEGRLTLLRPSQPLPLAVEDVSCAQAVSFPSGEEVAHGFYYPPRSAGLRAPEPSLPPLIVLVHGGPTAHSDPSLKLRVQFWTTRGFAVLDVNYRGSSGFGRRYRRSLYGEWGVKDVEDAVNGARYLASSGRADPARLAIRGGSAGGLTVLAAHAFHQVFAAGASYYGVSDMEALARDTHKFESRYLDQLVGPYPEQRQRYHSRSPIHHLDGFRRPLIILQGLQDEVVPPGQSEAIVQALRARGVPVAYLPFEGEQHGFRKAENIVRATEAELAFYGRVLGFEPADSLPPLFVDNLSET